jgi:hypothetical protein
VRTHLNGPVTAVGDVKADRATAGIEFDIAGLDLIFARDHAVFLTRVL